MAKQFPWRRKLRSLARRSVAQLANAGTEHLQVGYALNGDDEYDWVVWDTGEPTDGDEADPAGDRASDRQAGSYLQ